MNCKDSTRRAPPRLWRITRPLNRMPPRFRNYNIHAEQHFSRGKKCKHFFFRTAWEKGFGEGVWGGGGVDKFTWHNFHIICN